MSENPFDPLAPPTAEEEAAARRLAEALEEGGAVEGDAGEALAAARVLQAVAAAQGPADEVAARRLRKELVAKASRPVRRARRVLPILAAAASVVLAAGIVAVLTLARHRDATPTAATLNQREVEAKAALARLLAEPGRTGEGPVGALAETLASNRYEEKLDTLKDLRFSRLGAGDVLATSSSTTEPSPEPTPGGRS